MRSRLALVAAVVTAAAAQAPLPPTPSQQKDAAAIISAALNTTTAWERLAYITDTYGPRMSGSTALNDVIAYVSQLASSVDGLNVTLEPVMAPHWVRGDEWAVMQTPRIKTLHYVGLGYANSSGTPPVPITAEVLVVGSQAELLNRSAEAVGKIVLFDWTTWEGYGTTVAFRVYGPTWAASVGAVGCLIKSIAPWGLQTPHTGVSIPAGIPAGAVSMEDSLQMRRMVARGQVVTVTMYSEATLLPPVLSYNVIMDYTWPGAAFPDEIVLVSGHIDSWDNAEGAMDDGGGFLGAWEALRIVAELGLQVNRTLRAVGWLDEESGGVGAQQYAIDYGYTFNKTSLAMESDTGAFTPYGLSVTASPAALAQLQALAPLLTPLSPIGAAPNVTTGGEDVDEQVLCAQGVPCGALWPYDPRTLNSAASSECADILAPFNAFNLAPVMPFSVSSGYLQRHHTEADTVDHMDPVQLQQVAAANAVWAVSVANLPTLLPRQ